MAEPTTQSTVRSTKGGQFEHVISFFNEGFSPTAAFNSLTEHGNPGQASAMKNVETLSPDFITQGPALAVLVNGTQAAAVTELISFIMPQAVAADASYGIGPTKLFKISSTTVQSDATWPHAITNSSGATAGASVCVFKGSIYYFYNEASAGEIGKFDLASTFTDNWGSTVPTGAAALQAAAHPVDVKEDLIVFGNGRYVGVYTGTTSTLAATMLDFGSDALSADICFNANQWVIAVNTGPGGNNAGMGHIFLWTAAANTATLDDEISIGPYRIGFVYPQGGVIFVAYQDLTTSAGFKIGYLSGRQLKPISYFTGSLPTFAQKSLYKDVILFISQNLVYGAGAMVETLPLALSQLAGGGLATVGALAAPFGTPMVASTDGGSNFQLAKFSGFDTNCTWRSIVVSMISGIMKGIVDKVVVVTQTLAAGARCDLLLEFDQATAVAASANQITGTGKRRFIFKNFPGEHEDFRVFLNWANGSAVNACNIRQIRIMGHYVERS